MAKAPMVRGVPPLCGSLLTIGITVAGAVLADGGEARQTLYVAPDGKDTWSGRLPAPNRTRTDGPFAAPARARDVLRTLRGTSRVEGATVVLRGGIYYLTEPLTFGPEDSGNEQRPVVYKSYPGETAFLSGGKRITGWRDVKGAKPGMWTARLPEVRNGSWCFRQLFVMRRGEPFFTRSFRPHKGMMVVADLTWSPARKSAPHRAAQDDFVFFDGDLKAWPNLADVELIALHSWSASRLRIAHLDLEKHIVKFTAAPTFRIGHWYKDGRNPYYVENLPEELRNPGEWYLDRPSGTLYYLPLPGETMENTILVAPRLERVLQIRGNLDSKQFVENVTFEGLGFLHSDWALPEKGYDVSQGQPSLPAALEVTGARGCSFTRCIVANGGAYGIGLGLGAMNCSVLGCLMYDLGGGGVKVGDSSMKQSAEFPLLPTGNAVENNTITDTGVLHYSANGIWCGIVKGTRIRHNEVRNNPYTGIAVGWCWGPEPTSCAENLIERNHIHHVMQLVQDGGGIYTLGRQIGTVVRGNLIHDEAPSPFACGDGQCGLYFDEGSTGFLVEDNIVYAVAWENCKIAHNRNKPEDHVIRNNFLAIRPGDAGFPKDLAAQAGVEPAYVWKLARALRITPNPVYTMRLPLLPPVGIGFDYDFEDVPVGECPHKLGVNGVSGTAHIGVTQETACLGKRCLKVQDAKGLAKTFYPYISYTGGQVDKGMVELSFDVRQAPDKPAGFWVELRDYINKGQREYLPGPSLQFTAEGRVKVQNQELAAMPLGEWSHVVIRFALGEGKPKEYEVTVTLPGKSSRTAKLPYSSPGFTALTCLIISADEDRDGVFYLDNLRLAGK